MPNAQYELLATSPRDAPPDYDEDSSDERPAAIPPRDARFDQPTPPAWKRVSLILFICFLFWLCYRIPLLSQPTPPKIVHAERYSKEHKFRPAASPIITEKLKDGRLRVRGAHANVL